jgi:hypothetical protein
MPGDSGEPVVTTRVLSTLQTRLRVHWAPGIPHALCFLGENFYQSSGASRREIADAYAYLAI